LGIFFSFIIKNFVTSKSKINNNMRARIIIAEMKWVLISITVTFILLFLLKDSINLIGGNVVDLHLFIGLNNFLEILTYFTFSTFVVFGVKGFYEMYSDRISNVIMIVSGLILVFIIFILSCQILMET
jgi:hypothetical protein